MHFTKQLLPLALFSASMMTAHASWTYGEPAISQPYIGVKGGQIITDHAEKKVWSYGVYAGYNFDKHFGVEAEYQNSKAEKHIRPGAKSIDNWASQGGIAAVGDGTPIGIIIDDKLITTKDLKEAKQPIISHATTYGAYGTYRHNLGESDFYAKAKIGAARVTSYNFNSKNITVPVKTESNEGEGENSGGSQQENSVYPGTLLTNDKIHKAGFAGGLSLGYAPSPNLGVELGYSYITQDATGYNLGVHFAF